MNTNKQISLIQYLKSQINDTYQCWVLFNNNTYIILEDLKDNSIEGIKTAAIIALQNSLNQQTSVLTQHHIFDLPEVAGWTVNFSEGVYSFVKSSEFNGTPPSEIAIYMKGLNKTQKDLEELEIVYTNCPIC